MKRSCGDHASTQKSCVRKVNGYKWGEQIIPKNLAPRKDAATPSLAVKSKMYLRLQKRKQRGLCMVIKASLLNDACRMKMNEKKPTSKRLTIVYNNVHRERRIDANVYCRVCKATASMFCYCGAGLVPRISSLRSFFDFVKSPRNPILHFCDPADQAGILTVLVTLGSRSCKELCRILFVVAMISNEAVMKDIGQDVKTRRIDYLDNMFKRRKDEGRPTFRGGQFAGAVSVDKLATALREFCHNALRLLSPHLLQWQKAGRDRSRCVAALRAILSHINSIDVYGFGVYKKKKFAEHMVLAAMGNVFSLHFEQHWLNDLNDIWPIPDNSAANLELIFQGICNHRAGIVALLRGLRKSHSYTFPSIVAQLCFWSEQRNGRINWL